MGRDGRGGRGPLCFCGRAEPVGPLSTSTPETEGGALPVEVRGGGGASARLAAKAVGGGHAQRGCRARACVRSRAQGQTPTRKHWRKRAVLPQGSRGQEGKSGERGVAARHGTTGTQRHTPPPVVTASAGNMDICARPSREEPACSVVSWRQVVQRLWTRGGSRSGRISTVTVAGLSTSRSDGSQRANASTRLELSIAGTIPDIFTASSDFHCSSYSWSYDNCAHTLIWCPEINLVRRIS